MIELDLRNTSVAVYCPDVVSQAGIDATIQKCKQVETLLVLEVLVPASQSTEYRPMLERLGFNIGGTATKGTDVYVRFRLQIRRAGEGRPAYINPELSTGMAYSPIPPSDLERAAIADIERRFSPEAVEVRLTALQEGRE